MSVDWKARSYNLESSRVELRSHQCGYIYSAVSSSSWAGIGEPISTGRERGLFSGGSACLVRDETTFAIFTIRAVLAVIIKITTSIDILHLAVAIVWASRAVAITPIIITLTTVVLARGVVSPATTRWRRARATTGRTVASAGCSTWGVAVAA